ncbi:MAG: arsenate reductase family protein [Beijerinckiaceae bacterium]
MRTIIFFEKPGCQTNARQKKILGDAGHMVVAKSILTEPWTREFLHSFFGDKPVAGWFNPAAPAIKSGQVDPGKLDAALALSMLVADPILIKRPLIEIDGQRAAGFDMPWIEGCLGVSLDPRRVAAAQGCSRPPETQPCPDPAGHPGQGR